MCVGSIYGADWNAIRRWEIIAGRVNRQDDSIKSRLEIHRTLYTNVFIMYVITNVDRNGMK